MVNDISRVGNFEWRSFNDVTQGLCSQEGLELWGTRQISSILSQEQACNKMAISGVKLAEECMTVFTDLQKFKAQPLTQNNPILLNNVQYAIVLCEDLVYTYMYTIHAGWNYPSWSWSVLTSLTMIMCSQDDTSLTPLVLQYFLDQ